MVQIYRRQDAFGCPELKPEGGEPDTVRKIRMSGGSLDGMERIHPNVFHSEFVSPHPGNTVLLNGADPQPRRGLDLPKPHPLSVEHIP